MYTAIQSSSASSFFFQARLPLPPSINTIYLPIKNKQLRTRAASSKTMQKAIEELEQYKQDAALLLANPTVNWSIVNSLRLVPMPLQLVLLFYFYDHRSDIDNRLKTIQDVIFHRLELDDKMIENLVIFKHIDNTNPRVDIFLQTYSPLPAFLTFPTL